MTILKVDTSFINIDKCSAIHLTSEFSIKVILENNECLHIAFKNREDALNCISKIDTVLYNISDKVERLNSVVAYKLN